MSRIDIEQPNPLFAKRLRRLREEKGLSQEQLGQRAGLTGKAIYNLERGQHAPRKKNLEEISRALGISMTKLCAPSFPSFVSLMELLEERIEEEKATLDDYIKSATIQDRERLEYILKAYELAHGTRKLDLDFQIHREINSFGQNASRRINTLVLQFFSQIDEFIIDSDLMDPAREESLADIHIKLVKAALDRDKTRMLDEYDNHLAYSKGFVQTTFNLSFG